MRATRPLAAALAAAALAAPASAFKVGLVFGAGGRGDRSFNEAADRGLSRAKSELGVGVDRVEPAADSDREGALRDFASSGYDLTVGVGFILSADVDRVAKAFPSRRFACVDYSPTPGRAAPANVAALTFREQEASFLAGVIAALTSRTKTLGFVGGMDAPQIRKFEAGFRAGAKWADPGARVLSAFAGSEPRAFDDPAKGRELALDEIGRGADVVFHASGATGRGVFAAVREKRVLAIGVDVDQYGEAPGYVLTSVTKQVDEAVFEAVKAALAGRLKPVLELGLKEKGVDYVYDEHNRDLIPAAARAKAEEARALIVSGKLKVPSR
jgi:basic membrane protein A